MDDNGFAVIIWVAIGVGGLLVAGGATVGIMYATDYDLEALVTDKNCLGNSTVEVETKMWNIKTTVEVSAEQCAIIQVGHFVKYFVKSERTIIFQGEGGACLWDTGKSPSSPC